jgi:HD-GYP domain-containing protein (c-di-GMP phosphodiesterase class II)
VIRAVDAAMREVQNAVLARALYPSEHPRIRQSEERAFSLLSEVLANRGEVTVFSIDKRVVCDREVLPTSQKLSVALFRTLGARGVRQLTFREGLGIGELRGFLDSVAASRGRDAPPLAGGPHILLGTLSASAEHSEGPMILPEQGAIPVPGQATGALGEVWTGVSQHQNLDAGLLGDVVSSLSHAVVDSAGALLPLAPLKRHDEYTFTHIINVAILTMALGEAMGFDTNATHELGIAALLHDVGKMAVPLEVLTKNGRFTDEEFRAIQVHPVEGARILLRTPGVPWVTIIVAFEHHVRYDGGGYPRVPKGWKLNLASRITQIADVFDALRTHRPYRPGMPLDKIVGIMKSDAGTFFDPDMLDIFFDAVVARGLPADEAPSAASGAPPGGTSSPTAP